ncbi:MAG: hypothetical protein Q9165_002219 [Trypethelium subeluteriae]
MASNRLARHVERLSLQCAALKSSHHPSTQTLQPILTRSLATEAPLTTSASPLEAYATAHISSNSRIPSILATPPPPPSHISPPTVLTTLYSFPHLEPIRFAPYPSSHLALPLRRDLLHRAIIFEGDRSRQGTGSTKHRSEVHGSGRKIRPQKGTGKARLGDKKSPMLRGGGRAFPKKPRNFASDLPRKIYDLAFRTALSWRWRKGELVVVEGLVALEETKEGYVRELFETNGWGRERGGAGRSLVVAEEKKGRGQLFLGLNEGPGGVYGRALERWDVDVKDLLKGPRVIIEKKALDRMLAEHQTDLTNDRSGFPWKPSGSPPAKSGLTLLK